MSSLRHRRPRPTWRPGAARFTSSGHRRRWLVQAVRAHGLQVVTAADEAEAVVQGYSPSLAWKDLAEASYALARDIPGRLQHRHVSADRSWDRPGQRDARGSGRCGDRRRPIVTGKPHEPTWNSPARARCARPLVIGDRLDTDIAAATCGCDGFTAGVDRGELMARPVDLVAGGVADLCGTGPSVLARSSRRTDRRVGSSARRPM